ncbi:hypothetical protein [Paenibacillus sp. FSL R5-0470]
MADWNDEKANRDKDVLVDLTINVEDKEGNVASLPLSSEAYLLPMFEGNIIKWPFTTLQPTKEPVFQNFAFHLADLKRANPNFQPEQLSKIGFVFDKTKKGTVLIGNIGIQNEYVTGGNTP